MRALLILSFAILQFAVFPAQPVTLRSPRAANESALRESILKELSADPGTKNWYIQVDTYKDLVILHGWVLTRANRRALDNRIREMAGVGQVYNYVVTDDDVETVDRMINRSERIQVGIGNTYNRIADLGTNIDYRYELGTDYTPHPTIPIVVSAPDALALRVSYNINGDPETGNYNVRAGQHEIKVDTYEGLAILHGHVPSAQLANDAEHIAAQTPGVSMVYSYIQPEEEGTEVVTAVPYVVELFNEPLPSPKQGAPESRLYQATYGQNPDCQVEK